MSVASFTEGPHTRVNEIDDELTAITYFQVPMQNQVVKNKDSIANKEYVEFFDPNLKVPVSMVAALANGPLDGSYVVEPTSEGLNNTVLNFETAPVSGYALVDSGPCAYAQSRHVFPGVTSEMFSWWFTWHPIESERYSLWFPHAHIHNSVVDPARLSNENLSYAERLYGNPNHIIEYIGGNYLDGIIHFDTPESLGISEEMVMQKGFTFNASGIITTAEDPDSPLVLMIHLGRDTPEGFEILNRYWIGTHSSWDRFEKFPDGAIKSQKVIEKLSLGRDELKLFAYEMAVHDMTEFTTLGRLLPDLFREYS